MNDVAIAPEVLEARDKALVVLSTRAITSPQQYTELGALVVLGKKALVMLDEIYEERIAPLRDKLEPIYEEKRSYRDPIKDGLAKVGQLMLTWKRAEDERAAAATRKLQAEADERARKERERLEERARKAAESGKDEKAAALQEQAALVEAPVISIAPAAPKLEGLGTRRTWKARVVDASKVPDEWWVIDDAALQAFARATRGIKAVSGIVFEECESFARTRG